MRKIPYVIWVFLAGVIAAPAPVAFGQATAQAVSIFDELVREYNLVAFGNASFSGHSIQGGLAVQGNLSLSGSSGIGSHHSTSPDPSLFVSGKLTLHNDSSIGKGYASVNSTQNGHLQFKDNNRLEGGGKLLLNDIKTNPLTNAGPANWNWATIQSQALSISNTLKNAAQTGTIAVNTSSQTLTFTSSSSQPGVVVFQLDASKLGHSSYDGILNVNKIAFNLAADQTAVVNVINWDNKMLFSGYNLGTQTDVAGHLLWNFNGNGTLKIDGDFFGSILAPDAYLLKNSSNGRIDGQLIVRDIDYSGAQLHFEEFAPIGVLVPEPSTYALWMLALCGAGLWWHRRRVRASDTQG